MKWIDHNTSPMTVGMMDGLQEEITSVHNRLVIIDLSPWFFCSQWKWECSMTPSNKWVISNICQDSFVFSSLHYSIQRGFPVYN